MDTNTIHVKPLVFILDVDGTIIGNINPQIAFYELKQNKVNVKFTLKDLFDRFDQGLIRPYFDSFIKITKKNNPNSEFFIYTACEDKWGSFIATAFEKYYGIHFNRPFLTRKNCYYIDNKVRKSLNTITPIVKRSLQKKYGKNIDLTNRILIIDNGEVYQSNESAFLLKCPTYKFAIMENLPAFINEDDFRRNRLLIKETLKKIVPPRYQTYNEFQIEFYKQYVEYLERDKTNQDRFWLYLTRLLEVKNIKSFTPQTVAYINKKLSKRLSM